MKWLLSVFEKCGLTPHFHPENIPFARPCRDFLRQKKIGDAVFEALRRIKWI
jgi:hypothetical protein